MNIKILCPFLTLSIVMWITKYMVQCKIKYESCYSPNPPRATKKHWMEDTPRLEARVVAILSQQ